MTRLRAILRSRRQLDIKDTAETGSRGNSRAMDRSRSLEHFGAGDGIRTHDPNLGKVVLYP